MATTAAIYYFIVDALPPLVIFFDQVRHREEFLFTDITNNIRVISFLEKPA